MNKFFLSITLLFALAACTSSPKATENQSPVTDGTARPADTTLTKPVALSPRLTALGLTADSHWRGVNLGMPVATLRRVEKGDLFEEDRTHLGYAVDFPNLESTDALYFVSAGKVSAIEVDLYLNKKTAVTAYLTDLTAYFTSRYGAGQSAAGATTWTLPTGESLQLRDVSKGKDFGVKILITKQLFTNL